jgi:hypothetical protein
MKRALPTGISGSFAWASPAPVCCWLGPISRPLFVRFVANRLHVQTNDGGTHIGAPINRLHTIRFIDFIGEEASAMHGQIGGDARATGGSAPNRADQLDTAGQTILQLLHRAAGVAEENSRHALDVAQKLSHQLHSAKDRIADLEAELTARQERADRAEQWLHRVYTEIEDRFLQQDDGRRIMQRAVGRRA